MIKYRITYMLYITTRNVHIRVVFLKFFINTDWLPFIIFNLYKMLEIRLPLLITFQLRSISTVFRRQRHNRKPNTINYSLNLSTPTKKITAVSLGGCFFYFTCS